ncbi:disease resistance protein [Striga asiatica]|uniref:Disease resistance protein n=1 Tax=Striga asiatica TaxID=4170 RepID=A0A5A7PNM5_STRAF|nr:disease resistance protein [Striga asiatica]
MHQGNSYLSLRTVVAGRRGRGRLQLPLVRRCVEGWREGVQGGAAGRLPAGRLARGSAMRRRPSPVEEREGSSTGVGRGEEFGRHFFLVGILVAARLLVTQARERIRGRGNFHLYS